jgi:hypothetical protein
MVAAHRQAGNCDKQEQGRDGANRCGARRGETMRVLIVSPDTPGIDSIPEVRLIQSWHHTSILHGTVTAEDIFRACQETAFDIIHFATHGGPQGVLLSKGVIFTAEDIAQVARLKETPELFFNACSTGRIAAYTVRHGVRTAISAEIDLEDSTAWKLPLAFYSARRNGHAKDPVGAYILADSGDGEYSLVISPEWVRELQRQAAIAAAPHNALVMTRTEAIKWALALFALSTVINMAVSYAARLMGG